ncbi:MAG: hypothetical protein ACI89D_002471 [Bermanella sp.]|jgi:hypothetical protein
MKHARSPHHRVHGAILCLLLVASSSVSAHSFGQTYALPVPVWLYLYGAAAALVISFVVVGYFVTAQSINANLREYDLSGIWVPGRRLIATLRILSVGALLLIIIAGFIGTQSAYRNINMTLFWVIFVLGFTYLTALIGDWFSVLNPFRVLVEWIERALPNVFRGRWCYPDAFEYWPALVFYIAFIGIELFGRSTPLSLSVALLAYVLINFLGCWSVGKNTWFERCEFFSVFLRLIAKIAPFRIALDKNTLGERGSISGLYLRQPFGGLFQQRPIPFSLLMFVLFVLSSTAFDGLHETAIWVGAFWRNLYQGVLMPIYGNASPVTFPVIRKLFFSYQAGALVLSPFIYLAAYAIFIYLAKVITRHVLPFKQLLLSFGLSLIPIAFAYHLTHYFTLLQVQGAQMLHLISDPLGLGWNLFGTARMAINIIPDMSVVWHTQVFVIIVGHIVSVYIAHLQALKIFPDRRMAVLSQVPILFLMVGFTAVGLWILSLPLAPGNVLG